MDRRAGSEHDRFCPTRWDFKSDTFSILHGHVAVSADMDLRLSEALGTSAGFWLRMQGQRDLWEARQRADARQPVARLAA